MKRVSRQLGEKGGTIEDPDKRLKFLDLYEMD